MTIYLGKMREERDVSGMTRCRHGRDPEGCEWCLSEGGTHCREMMQSLVRSYHAHNHGGEGNHNGSSRGRSMLNAPGHHHANPGMEDNGTVCGWCELWQKILDENNGR